MEFYSSVMQSALNFLSSLFVFARNFVEKIRYGTGLIAHSRGVRDPRSLKRYHCRIVQEGARSTPLDVLYPPVEVLPQYRAPASDPT